MQRTPIKDFINFKQMSSNEILLNLENHRNFASSELVGALIELSVRDQIEQFDWNEHPITASALYDLKKRQARLNGKHLSQTQLILDRLRVRDETFWQMNAAFVLGMLHKFAARDLAQFLDIFDREILDQMGEPLAL